MQVAGVQAVARNESLHWCAVVSAVLCRYQARELWLGLKAPLERLGVRMVCIVHEWIDREVCALGLECFPSEAVLQFVWKMCCP